MIGGALAGAAGSIVSQGVGVATGIQAKFSWKGVALAAIGGGIGGGLGGSGIFGQVTNTGFQAGSIGIKSGVVNAAVQGVASNVLNQGVGLVTGLQNKFSFAGVAAAGIGAAAGYGIGRALGGYQGEALSRREGRFIIESFRGSATFGNQLASSAAGAIASAATRSAINGESFGDNVLRALPDAIGNTIGNAVGNAVARAARSTEAEDDPRIDVDPTVALSGDRVTGGNGVSAQFENPITIPISNVAPKFDESETFTKLIITDIPLNSSHFQEIAFLEDDNTPNKLTISESRRKGSKAIAAAQVTRDGPTTSPRDSFDMILFESPNGDHWVDLRFTAFFDFKNGTDVSGNPLVWSPKEGDAFIKRFEGDIDRLWGAVPVFTKSDKSVVRLEISIESRDFNSAQYSQALAADRAVWRVNVTKTDKFINSSVASNNVFRLDSLDGTSHNNSENTIPHEFGHILGNRDEYFANSRYKNDNSIMDARGGNGTVKIRHVNLFREWVSKKIK